MESIENRCGKKGDGTVLIKRGKAQQNGIRIYIRGGTVLKREKAQQNGIRIYLYIDIDLGKKTTIPF